jgi:hypothetical protein
MGEVWLKCGRRRERRTVVNRNLGGDVFYWVGGPQRYSTKNGRCTEAEWLEWQQGAEQIE